MNDGHPRDELSAYLDGALDEATAQWVDVHVLVCAECRDELDRVRDARRALRHLPAVDPPPGFLESLLPTDDGSASRPRAEGPPARQGSRAWWAANAAVAAAAALVLVGVSGGSAAQAVAPQVATAVARHAATMSAVSAAADTAVSAPARAHSLSKPYVAPRDLAGYRLVDAYAMPAGVQLLYEKGSAGLSVFEQEGSAPAHTTSLAGHAVEVVSRAGLVVTVVGDDAGAVHTAAARLRPGPSVAHRCGDVLEGLSPVG